MTDQVLQADLDALARLQPQVEQLAGEVTRAGHGEIAGGATAAEAPSLAAAQDMSARTVPAMKAAVAGRFTKVADMIELARQGFLATEEQLLTAVSAMPSLLPPGRLRPPCRPSRRS